MPDPASSPDPPRFDPARRRAVTLALALISATAALEGTVVSTAMPTIVGDLQGLSLYSWVFSVFLLTSTVTMPLYGRLADIYGRRRVLLLSISRLRPTPMWQSSANAGGGAAHSPTPRAVTSRSENSRIWSAAPSPWVPRHPRTVAAATLWCGA